MARIVAIEAAHAQIIADIIDTANLHTIQPPDKPVFDGTGQRWNLAKAAENGDEVLRVMLAKVSELAERQDGPIDAISIAISAAVENMLDACLTHESSSTVISFADFQAAMNKMFHRRIPLYVGNRSTMAAVGEFEIGQRLAQQVSLQRDFHHLLYATISSNLGAGLILDGTLYVGANGLAGEIGHLVLDPASTERCPACGQRGCASVLASGRALVHSVKTQLANGQGITEIITEVTARGKGDEQGDPLTEPWADTGYSETITIGRDNYEIDARAILRAARRSPVAAQAVSKMVGYLAQLVAELTHIFDPELIVLGGIATAYPGLHDEVGQALTNRRMLRPQGRSIPELLSAWLDSKSALYGAALWAEQKLQGTSPKPKNTSAEFQDSSLEPKPPIHLADRQPPATPPGPSRPASSN